jgi:hypothetical protein
LQAADTNNDGILTKEEWNAAGLPEQAFAAFDANGDGKADADEIKAGRERMRQARGGGGGGRE